MQKRFDVVILGAGGAGLMCAIQAGKRGRRVLILDHNQKIGSKILISGGGRCNFTNVGASPKNYVSQNPHFCKSALSRFKPEDFIELVRKKQIAFHEKKLGQLFCDGSAQNIVDLLVSECNEAHVEFALGYQILSVKRVEEGGFEVRCDADRTFYAQSVVVATGGLSIPKIGATGFGYTIAKQFGLQIVPTVAALDGFVWDAVPALAALKGLSGISVDCTMTCGGVTFRENLLFTHTGLSGPVALQASLYWSVGQKVEINFLPDLGLYGFLLEKKKSGNNALLKNLLAELLPARFTAAFCDIVAAPILPLQQIALKDLEVFCKQVQAWSFIPAGTVGYSKAEVTRGGVDTRELSSKTMEAIKVPGLYFIGEVVDVTGWLGGYNFQWAWASGSAAGQVA